jgi:hypothetical protein
MKKPHMGLFSYIFWYMERRDYPQTASVVETVVVAVVVEFPVESTHWYDPLFRRACTAHTVAPGVATVAAPREHTTAVLRAAAPSTRAFKPPVPELIKIDPADLQSAEYGAAAVPWVATIP